MKKIITKRTIVPLLCLVVFAIIGIKAILPTPAPQIDTATTEGQKITSAQLAQKPWYVEFWSVNCSTCIADFDQLIELQNRLHASGGQVIAVASNQDDVQQVIHISKPLRAAGIWVVHDKNSAIAQAFSHNGITPYGFLIDPQGYIAAIHVGKLDIHTLLNRLDLL